ncbi:amino acid ABC transporter permease [Methanospirillum purgamenti]|uniref:Amino acid ABC transporter permease n=1 Tax=Methanospirillum hungatei TaxID=2203 RepID=A0A8F5ZIA1_METHU|nr:amino acid ABC transporter permease [Methanospirillum hungatei]QXO95998.1 amino acid ABC transporter permease [Methanospirillum hungatei]
MDQTTFIFDVMIPAFGNGLLMTLALVAVTAPIGLLIGIGVACGRVYGGKGLTWLMQLYAIFFRGCPLLLLLFILYFGLPSFGIVLTPFVASVLGFILCNSSYNSEYIRGSILSVKEGQLIAAKALGMTKNQAVLNIVLPQALRRSIPGISNEFIYLIKYSSLKYFAYNETFFAVALVYLALVTITTFGANALEKKYAIPG